jgi:hypothetical protein
MSLPCHMAGCHVTVTVAALLSEVLRSQAHATQIIAPAADQKRKQDRCNMRRTREGISNRRLNTSRQYQRGQLHCHCTRYRYLTTTLAAAQPFPADVPAAASRAPAP